MLSIVITFPVPLAPTSFNINGQYDALDYTTIQLEWDPPYGVGPERVVDVYLIEISPGPLSHPASNFVSSSPWNVTIEYNVEYLTTITAINCAGESDPFVLPAFEFSEPLHYSYGT